MTKLGSIRTSFFWDQTKILPSTSRQKLSRESSMKSAFNHSVIYSATEIFTLYSSGEPKLALISLNGTVSGGVALSLYSQQV